MLTIALRRASSVALVGASLAVVGVSPAGCAATEGVCRCAPPDAERPGQDARADARAPPSSAPRFVDVTASAGLAIEHLRGVPCPDQRPCESYYFSGGAAVGDYDGDRWPDLYLPAPGGPGTLLHNRGDGTFEDATAGSGLDAPPEGGATRTAGGNGAAFADVDNDGDLDLYVTGFSLSEPGRHFLWINQGQGQFVEEAAARGADLPHPSPLAGQSVAVGDYDRDGFPDLHVTEWTPQQIARPRTRLLHNRGRAMPGHFEDVTRSAGVLTFSEACWEVRTSCTQFGFASALSDLDGDGWPDLVVVSDFGLSRLFWNRGDGSFELGFRTSDLEGDENGMGSTIGDIDGDGDLDWFVSSIYDPQFRCAQGLCNWGSSGNRLYRNQGDRVFADATDELGVRESGWGWGSALFDADNDGDLDLAVANGIDSPIHEWDDSYGDDPLRFWMNEGDGPMVERAEAAGIAGAIDGRGLVVLDADRDGDLDLLVVHNGRAPSYLRNDSPTQGYLRVTLAPDSGASEAVGARVILTRPDGRRLVREIVSATHFIGQSERVAHFGLGHDQTASLEIHWPEGDVTYVPDVPVNEEITVSERGEITSAGRR